VDVIVGFPGETHKDFLETYQFINELDISYLHVFTYSERQNTLAVTMGGAVSHNDRSDRSRALHNLSDKKRRRFYEDNIGKISQVLFENDVSEGMMYGFTENYIRVTAKYDPLLINEIKNARLSEIGNDGLMHVSEVEEEFLTH
jgi:threonylcarbamoyladenosine tRNA methylthiotransferase MtaB